MIDLLLQTNDDVFEIGVLNLLLMAIDLQLVGDLAKLGLDLLTGGQLPLTAELINLLGVALREGLEISLQLSILPLKSIELRARMHVGDFILKVLLLGWVQAMSLNPVWVDLKRLVEGTLE